jgi:D-alanine-D-alanine ligase-like ATP-grasp enzyme
MHPLAWVHRAEARAIARELRALGRNVRLARFSGEASARAGILVLRLSDPVMLRAAAVYGDAGAAYRGPGAAAMARCYDKWVAGRAVAAQGIDCPRTRLAALAADLPRPLVLKPRQGSDSLGLRILRRGEVPASLKNERTLAQVQAFGTEITVGVIDGLAGMPLRLKLSFGVPHTFLRKYLLPPGREALSDDATLAANARSTALRAASILGVDWAARVDFIHERSTGRLLFLECDAAPLVGPDSAFAASLGAGGMERDEQLARLLGEF